MSGNPTVLMLGGHAFQAVGFGFKSLDRETEVDWAKIEVTGRETALHWTGPKGQEIKIEGAIFPVALGGLGTLDKLRADHSSGRVMMLVTGAGDVLGKYVGDGKISEKMKRLTADASPEHVEYTISLRRAGGSVGGLGLAGLSGLGGLANVLAAAVPGVAGVAAAAAQAVAAAGPITQVALAVAQETRR
jgi:uncharacterized protein